MFLGPKKQCIRRNQSNLQEGILFLEPKKLCIRRNQSNLQEGILVLEPKKLCIRRNQSNLQEEILFLGPKKLCIRKNQSNLQEEILFLGPKKLCIRKNQSNLQEGILFLGPKKQCIRRNQSNLQEKSLSLKQKKDHQSNLQEGILFLEPKKLCIRKNQSNLQEGILFLEPKKLCIRKNQSNLQEGILFLGPKKQSIRRNQSNLQEKTQSLKQKKENQSSFLEKILFSRLKKFCIKRNQSREQGKIRLLKSKKKNARISQKKRARENPYVLECERIKKQQIRQGKRKINDDLEITVPRKKIKHDIDLLPKNFQKNFETIEESIKRFHSVISFGPIYVCSCCHQTWFRKSVSMLKNTHIPAESKRLHCTEFTSVGNEEWICHTCLSALRDSKLPKLSVANGMKWPDKPPELNLHQLEERLIALRIPFMQIRELPRGGQYSLKGNVINVPVDIQPTINCLPRPMDENFTVAIQLKKKLSYKKVDFKENVRPLRVLSALHWLMKNSELYKKSCIVVDDNWFQEVTESAEDTVREFLEVSKEQCKEKNYTENEKQKQEKTTENDIEASNDYDSDHYSEIDANDHVGNIDTLVDDADIDNKYDKVFTFAPGEGQHPLSLYQDKDAEYLCFPTIFCGQTPPSRDERLVPVHYSDIVKWELRGVDRRAAQSVPNIFFKHKKLQMKQISDKVNLAVRRCKKRGQKITAAEARDSSYVDKLVNLDEGNYIFRQLRNSPAYLETRKKDIFAMIRQLSLPTWFMSLSAADTRWTDLLKMLAKLNDGIDYSEKELEHLSWQEKTKLVQKDPVTCSRYFDHRVQEFLNTVLKSSCEPIGKLLDYFYRVEFQQRGSPHIHMLV